MTAWMVLDTETTGLPADDRARCEVRAVEVGVALVGPGGVLASRSLLVCPPVWSYQTQAAEKIHGLSRAYITAHGMSPAEAWATINGWTLEWQPAGLLAWNASFDAEILARLALDAGQSAPVPWPAVSLAVRPGVPDVAPEGCLLRWYRALREARGQSRGRVALAAAAAAEGIAGRSVAFHGAEEDARIAAEILLRSLAPVP